MKLDDTLYQRNFKINNSTHIPSTLFNKRESQTKEMAFSVLIFKKNIHASTSVRGANIKIRCINKPMHTMQYVDFACIFSLVCRAFSSKT